MFLLLFSYQVFMTSSIKMGSAYHCPACKSSDIIENEGTIHCPKCKLDFNKEHLGKIDDENILSVQELGGFVDSFDELKDEETRERFLRAIEEDGFDLIDEDDEL
jgi:hypothetical protein